MSRSIDASEREIQNSILELLKLEGIFALRLQTGAAKIGNQLVRFHSGGSGVADIVAFPRMRQREMQPPVLDTLGYGIGLWIEVKSVTGRQTPEQVAFEDNMRARGMYYLLARDLGDVTEWISQHR